MRRSPDEIEETREQSVMAIWLASDRLVRRYDEGQQRREARTGSRRCGQRI